MGSRTMGILGSNYRLACSTIFHGDHGSIVGGSRDIGESSIRTLFFLRTIEAGVAAVSGSI